MVYEHIEEILNRALALVGRVEDVYRLGSPQIRRLCNQFLFEQVLVDVDEDEGTQVTGATLREPWATLLAPSFQAVMAASTRNPGRDLGRRGSKDESLVPPAGARTDLRRPVRLRRRVELAQIKTM